MNAFIDRMLLQLGDPTQLAPVLDPPADATHAQLQQLVEAIYPLPNATLHGVSGLQIRSIVRERPIYPMRGRNGTWTQTTPPYTRTDVTYENRDRTQVIWVDLYVDAAVSLLLEIDAGTVDTITNVLLTGFTTLAQFQARFQFLDIDAFMAERHITTVDQLINDFPAYLTQVHLKAPPVFNPLDPANQIVVPLRLAVFIRDPVDVTGTLRDVKSACAIMQDAIAYQTDTDLGPINAPMAPVVVFSQAGLTGSPITSAAVTAAYAAEQVLALFLTPS